MKIPQRLPFDRISLRDVVLVVIVTALAAGVGIASASALDLIGPSGPSELSVTTECTGSVTVSTSATNFPPHLGPSGFSGDSDEAVRNFYIDSTSSLWNRSHRLESVKQVYIPSKGTTTKGVYIRRLNVTSGRAIERLSPLNDRRNATLYSEGLREWHRYTGITRQNVPRGLPPSTRAGYVPENRTMYATLQGPQVGMNNTGKSRMGFLVLGGAELEFIGQRTDTGTLVYNVTHVPERAVGLGRVVETSGCLEIDPESGVMRDARFRATGIYRGDRYMLTTRYTVTQLGGPTPVDRPEWIDRAERVATNRSIDFGGEGSSGSGNSTGEGQTDVQAGFLNETARETIYLYIPPGERVPPSGSLVTVDSPSGTRTANLSYDGDGFTYILIGRENGSLATEVVSLEFPPSTLQTVVEKTGPDAEIVPDIGDVEWDSDVTVSVYTEQGVLYSDSTNTSGISG